MLKNQTIQFEAVTLAHLPLLDNWLGKPHVARWWDNPDALLERVRTKRSSTPAADGYVIVVGTQSVGYIQSWDASCFAADYYAAEWWLRDLPLGTIGLDVFLGRLGMTGRGLGTEIISEFATKLIDRGAKCLIVDPELRNHRAISAYYKAGFIPVAKYPYSPERDGETNEDRGTLVMQHAAKQQ